MTVSATARRAGPYACNGVLTSFAFAFKVFADADIRVVHLTDEGVESDLTLTTNYTVTRNADQENNPGGTITTTGGASPYDTGDSLTIIGNVAYTQGADISNGGAFFPDVVEDALDRATILIQQLKELVVRAFVAPASDSNPLLTLPTASLRANKYLGFDALGNVGAYDPADGALSDAANVNFLQSGTGALSRTVESKLREIKSITDYGAATTSSAAVNTPLIQAAIDANYGKCLIIPPGTFPVATTGQTSAAIGAVGDALTITDEITLIFEGILKGTNNCNVLHVNAGAQDVVTLIYEGGGLEGLDRVWVPAYAQFNKNGALVKWTAGIPRIYHVKLINPVQYAIYSDGADEGHVEGVEIIGGWTTYDASRVAGPNDNNYGIALYNTSTGWKIDGLKTVANAALGKCSQVIGSDASTGLGVADKTQILNCRLRNQHEKGVYLFGADTQVIGNHVVGCANGEGIRTIGARPQVNDNLVASCDGGGITLYDAGGGMCRGNQLSDIRGSGITLAYYPDEVIGTATLDHACIHSNQIEMDSGMTSGGRGIDVRIGMDVAAGDVASTEDGIEVVNNHITKANYHSSDPLAAIDFSVYNTASVYRDLRVEGNHVNDCGAIGIRFNAATYGYAKIRNNIVRDPAQSVARSGFVFETGVAMVGQEISGNEARKENGANAMTYGFENKTDTANIQSCRIAGNHSRGHGTAGYLNIEHTSNSRSGNRMGDNSLHGSFTCTAGAATAISNSNARTGMRISLYPTNAAAAALQGHASGALHYEGTFVAGTSLTLVSTGGVAGGTENFDYEIHV